VKSVIVGCFALFLGALVGCTQESSVAPAAPAPTAPAPAETSAQPSDETAAANESSEQETADNVVGDEKEGANTDSAEQETDESESPEQVAQSENSEEEKAAGDDSSTATLKIRFVYGGAEAPKREKLDGVKGDFCGKFEIDDESLIVHPENKGIQNVIVYVFTGRGGIKLPDFPPRGEVVTLANKNCRFEPHVLAVRAGDTLRVTNPDDTGHNANLNFFNNKAQNLLIPKKQERSVVVEESEPAPIPVDCNIHPWMKAFLVITDHPFVAISDENGDLTIEGLPVNEKIPFRVNQQSATIKEVIINNETVEWKKSLFELKLKPGVNDMGTVTIPADAFE